MLRVLIAGDTLFYTEGLAILLGNDKRFAVVGVAHSADELLVAASRLEPQVVLMDLALPDGVESLRTLAVRAPSTRVVVLAVPEVEQEIVACAEAGAAGFVTRGSTLAELADTVRSVAQGEQPCSPRIAAALLHHVGALARKNEPPPRDAPPLTRREVQVLALIDEGLSNKQIAARLLIELPTVKNHVHHILDKLQVNRRSEAAARVRAANGGSIQRTALVRD